MNHLIHAMKSFTPAHTMHAWYSTPSITEHSKLSINFFCINLVSFSAHLVVCSINIDAISIQNISNNCCTTLIKTVSFGEIPNAAILHALRYQPADHSSFLLVPTRMMDTSRVHKDSISHSGNLIIWIITCNTHRCMANSIKQWSYLHSNLTTSFWNSGCQSGYICYTIPLPES